MEQPKTVEPRGPKVRRQDPTQGTVEQIDDLLYIVRDNSGTVLDAGIEEFAELERMNNKYLKLTLRGLEGTKPLVLMIESESVISVRKFGEK